MVLEGMIEFNKCIELLERVRDEMCEDVLESEDVCDLVWEATGDGVRGVTGEHGGDGSYLYR